MKKIFIVIALSFMYPSLVSAAVAITQTANPAGVAASSTVATYSSVSIGTAAADRIVAVVVGSELNNSTASLVTIDSGGGAVDMTPSTEGSLGALRARIFYLLVPTGTTATITVKYSNTSPADTANHIAVYKVTGANTVLSAEGGNGSTDMDANAPLTTGSVTIPANGGFLAIASGATDTVAKAWANATEDLDVDAGGLRFTTATRTTAGTVTITVTGTTNNEDGALSYAIFAVSVAPTVTTQSVSSIGVTTATGNGNVTLSGGSDVTERGVVANTTGTPTTSDLKFTAATGGTGAFTASMTSLSGDTHYFVRAYAINSLGTSYGSQVEFDTLNLSPTVALNSPADEATGVSTTPDLVFTGTDGEADDIEYEVQIDPANTFDSGIGGYDIASATFTQIALSVSGQEDGPKDILFNNDGTKLYMLGSTGVDVNEYALSTPYDISSGSFTQIALSVSGQETAPRDMLFNDDGTKLYLIGFTGVDVNEYALSTPYDISSGSFTQIALSVAGEETQPTAMLYNNDGTKLYVMGLTGVDVNEYALSTPYDISSGSFTQIALSVSGQEATPRSMIFNNDGTKLYVMGSSGDDINEYALSTPYDISSGSFTQIALDVSGQEDGPESMLFNNNGTKLYVMGFTGDDINEYALSAAPLLDKLSVTPDATFTNLDDGGDTHPFTSGDQIEYTVQAGDELDNDTEYFWRVRAIDPSGSNTFGAWSATRSFTTEAGAGAVTPTVTTVAASSITGTTATLNGNITDTGGETGAPTEHGFYWGTESDLVGGDTATITLGDYSGTGAFNDALSSLTPTVTYYFQAYATNSAGTGTGSILNFTTDDTTPVRTLRLFEGYKIKFTTGKIILYPTN